MHIESTESATHYVGAPTTLPGNGAAVLFDLDTPVALNINAAQVNTYDAYSAGLAGNTTTLELYTCPTTAIGNETVQTAWTLRATGTLLMSATTWSTVTFNTPAAITAGQYGVMLRVLPYNGNYVPILVQCNSAACGGSQVLPFTFRDQFVTLTNSAFTRDVWVAGAGRGTYVPNFGIDYDVSPNVARFNKYGQGCYFLPYSFYEHMLAGGTFDLSNNTLQLIFTGNSYTVIGVPGAPIPGVSWFSPGTGGPAVGAETGSHNVTAAPPALSNTGPGTPTEWDDAFSSIITLPFTIQAPNGVSTNQIVVHSNGGIMLDPTGLVAGGATAFYGNILGLLAGNPRLFPLFSDLDPSVAATTTGAIYYDLDPSAQTVYITWDAVPIWNGPTSISTFQIAVHSSSVIEYRYFSCAYTNPNASDAIVGFTPGRGSVDPTSTDLSNILPPPVGTGTPLTTGDGALPLDLDLDARPVLGATPNLLLANLHIDNNNPTSPVPYVIVANLGAQFPGAALAGFGMPGCELYLPFVGNVVLGFSLHVVPSSTPAMRALAVPANPGLAGMNVFLQGFGLTPLYNSAGVWASNGLCIVLNGV